MDIYIYLKETDLGPSILTLTTLGFKLLDMKI